MPEDRTTSTGSKGFMDEVGGSADPGRTAVLARQTRLLEATLSAIPDFVCAFDPQRRFAYANPAMLALFGLSSEELLGKTLADLDYPAALADRLNGHINHVLSEGAIIEDEVFYRSPTGYGAYFDFVWDPARAEDGSVELVVGVSRNTSERRAIEDDLRKSEARLRAATELVGIGIYSWDPVTGALDWDDRIRAMWGLPPGFEVDTDVFEGGIHPDDLPAVRRATAECIDPAGDGGYDIEYRVIGRDGLTRSIATSGRTTFAEGRAIHFIGAAIDVTLQRLNEAAVRASDALFRSFADNSGNLIWIGDPVEGKVLYRSAAYERIFGLPLSEAPTAFDELMKVVHPDDRLLVEHALAAVKAGEVMKVEYRVVCPSDGAIRSLRDTNFPILDEQGAVALIGGITEDLTQEQVRQAYIVCGRAAEARRLSAVVRAEGFRVRTFASGSAFLDVASVLSPGCVLVDLRNARIEGLAIPRELKARSIDLPAIALDAPGANVEAGVAAMKAGAIDYLTLAGEPSFGGRLATAMAECLAAARPTRQDENAGARVDRLTARERQVLVGLIEGGTNKSMGQKLGISPRTVEMHRAQVMSRLNASSLTELLQIALSAGIVPAAGGAPGQRSAS